jgi:hypothetical protein
MERKVSWLTRTVHNVLNFVRLRRLSDMLLDDVGQ